jgi:hypothetical protein
MLTVARMLEFFKNKFLGEVNPDRKKERNYEATERKKNPINELQILEEHKDIVRLLVKIDELRFFLFF